MHYITVKSGSRDVNTLAFGHVSYYLRANRSGLGPNIRDWGEKASDMDDSYDTERIVQVWAAARDDKHHGGKTAFTIGELSREFGVTLRALRFYENKGLMSPQREGLSRL